MLHDLSRQTCLSWVEIDISEDDQLLQRYGLTIPVLRRQDTAAEISWPFCSEDILALMR